MEELYRANLTAFIEMAGLVAQLKDSIGTDTEKDEALRECLRCMFIPLRNIGVFPEMQAVEEEIALDAFTPILAEVLR